MLNHPIFSLETNSSTCYYIAYSQTRLRDHGSGSHSMVPIMIDFCAPNCSFLVFPESQREYFYKLFSINGASCHSWLIQTKSSVFRPRPTITLE